MTNTVFWDVTPCGSCKNRRLGGTYRLHHQGDKNRRGRNNVSGTSNRSRQRRNTSMFRLLVTADLAPRTPISVTLMLVAIRFSEAKVASYC
jgi:hypothetical protein